MLLADRARFCNVKLFSIALPRRHIIQSIFGNTLPLYRVVFKGILQNMLHYVVVLQKLLKLVRLKQCALRYLNGKLHNTRVIFMINARLYRKIHCKLVLEMNASINKFELYIVFKWLNLLFLFILQSWQMELRALLHKTLVLPVTGQL